MSASIIGKPPEQKRGAVFGDVPVGGQCLGRGTHLLRLTSPYPNGRNARCLHSGDLCTVGHDEPVTPLTVTPAEPPPDPAATTYGELEPGDLFRFVHDDDDDTPHTRGPVTHGRHGRQAEECPPDSEPVRRVSPIEAAAHVLGPDAGASVVVHEEPGTCVRRSMSGSGVVLEGALLGAVKSWGWAESLCAQLAALLSTPEPKRCCGGERRPGHEPGCDLYEPATADPEPSTWCESEARKNGHGEDCARAEWDTNPCTCPEPAEDRAKPAPGWGEPWQSLAGWWNTARDGYVVGPKHETEEAALRFTYTSEAEEGYAEQARKAGES